jgi:iron complex outermembrane receptor protein
MTNARALRTAMFATTALCAAWASQAVAQTAAATPDESIVEEVVVVGSRIEGAKATAALPVTVIDAKQLDAVAPARATTCSARSRRWAT